MTHEAPSERKPYDIDSLTDVALRVFAQKGYNGSTMDDVARAAGITKASIYHHVAGKEALLASGLNRALTALFAILDEPQAQGGRAAARLHHVVRRVVEETIRLLPELSILVRVRGNSQTELAALDRRRAFDRAVGQLIEDAQSEGDVDPALDPMVASRLIFGMSNSIVEWYRPAGRVAPESLIDAIERQVFSGLDRPAG